MSLAQRRKVSARSGIGQRRLRDVGRGTSVTWSPRDQHVSTATALWTLYYHRRPIHRHHLEPEKNKRLLPTNFNCRFVFTALHAMQTRSSDEKAVRPSVRLSVCLSVRPSVKSVNCNKTEERSVQIFILYERSFSLVFWEEEGLVGGDPFYLKFRANRPPLERNRRCSTDIRS